MAVCRILACNGPARVIHLHLRCQSHGTCPIHQLSFRYSELNYSNRTDGRKHQISGQWVVPRGMNDRSRFRILNQPALPDVSLRRSD
eukprot:6186885-Pleurochrysis_carterae.AAC.4